jgi:hypothetical protein
MQVLHPSQKFELPPLGIIENMGLKLWHWDYLQWYDLPTEFHKNLLIASKGDRVTNRNDSNLISLNFFRTEYNIFVSSTSRSPNCFISVNMQLLFVEVYLYMRTCWKFRPFFTSPCLIFLRCSIWFIDAMATISRFETQTGAVRTFFFSVQFDSIEIKSCYEVSLHWKCSYSSCMKYSFKWAVINL